MAPKDRFSAAAAQIAAIASGLTGTLDVCAGAGLDFYLALGVILAQFLVAMVGVIAALGSVAFSWAGVALAVGEATVSTGMITAAVLALITVLTAQSTQMTSLHAEATDGSAFPGGKWPDPHTSTDDYAS